MFKNQITGSLQVTKHSHSEVVNVAATGKSQLCRSMPNLYCIQRDPHLSPGALSSDHGGCGLGTRLASSESKWKSSYTIPNFLCNSTQSNLDIILHSFLYIYLPGVRDVLFHDIHASTCVAD